jgi:2-aminoadipate transaminase
VPIIEDDPYGQLRYEGEHLPSLVVLDREHNHHDEKYELGNVIYLSTFSKTLAPGLRLGWIVAPQEVITKLAQLKQGADLHTSTFNQIVAYEVAKDGYLDGHVRLIRRVYRERRDVMLAALKEYFPEECTWTRPQGGLFLWVTLPAGLRSSELFKTALEENVAFVPGESFYAVPDAMGERQLRLNFSNATPEKIREGIRRLANAVKRQMLAKGLIAVSAVHAD